MFVPPLIPLQFHAHGPEPVTGVTVPAVHKFDDGVDVTPTPLADPHEPSVALFALQFAVVPPLTPAHVHVNGPVPATADGEPTLHKFDDGAE